MFLLTTINDKALRYNFRNVQFNFIPRVVTYFHQK
jgi:hypothetical protein